MTSQEPTTPLLDVLLESWDRNNAILVNLLLAIPEDLLPSRALPESPTAAELFGHMHYCRLVFVAEDAPECALPVPKTEWVAGHTPGEMAAMLNESAAAVREAVRARLESLRPFDRHYDHPILMLQHLIWHEGYHHGQIKLAMKAAGRPFDDEEIGQCTWNLWMKKGIAWHR